MGRRYEMVVGYLLGGQDGVEQQPISLQTQVVSQKTRDIDPMFDQCWANVVDGGPTLVKHWVDVSCFSGMPTVVFADRTMRTWHFELAHLQPS